MKHLLWLGLGVMIVTIAGCSSGAPPAPMGFARRPANPQVVTPVTGDHTPPAAPAPVPVGALTDQGAPPANPSPAPMLVTGPMAPAKLSDDVAPEGIRSLPAAERDRLIANAKSARGITILCRGDRTRPSPAYLSTLLRRGIDTKRFLVAAGVDPGCIRIYGRSAGGFIADNGTVAGRAKNRRVEIHFL